MTSCHCQATDQQFDARIAQRDLRRFLRRGPEPSTQHILDAVLAYPLPAQPDLLDVGGGVGVLHHALLDRGFGHAGRVDFPQGDFAAVAPDLGVGRGVVRA